MIGSLEGLFTGKTAAPFTASPSSGEESTTQSSESASNDSTFLATLYQMLVAPTLPQIVNATEPQTDEAEQGVATISETENSNQQPAIQIQSNADDNLFDAIQLNESLELEEAKKSASTFHAPSPSVIEQTGTIPLAGLQFEFDDTLDIVKQVEPRIVGETVEPSGLNTEVQHEISSLTPNDDRVIDNVERTISSEYVAAQTERSASNQETNVLLTTKATSVESRPELAQRLRESNAFEDARTENSPSIIGSSDLSSAEAKTLVQRTIELLPSASSFFRKNEARATDARVEKQMESQNVRHSTQLFPFGISRETNNELQAIADSFAQVLPKAITWQPIDVEASSMNSGKAGFEASSTIQQASNLEPDFQVLQPKQETISKREQQEKSELGRESKALNSSETQFVVARNEQLLDSSVKVATANENVSPEQQIVDSSVESKDNYTAEVEPNHNSPHELLKASQLTKLETTIDVAKAVAFDIHPTSHSITRGEAQLEKSSLVREAIPNDFARNLVVKISDELRAHIEGRASEVRVVMKPESMGELSLRVAMDAGKLTATMDVSQPAVRSALEAQLPQLREALASQGIDVQRFDIVSSGGKQFQQSHEGAGSHSRPQSKRRMDVAVAQKYENAKFLGYNTVEYII